VSRSNKSLANDELYEKQVKKLKPYSEELTAIQAASAMQAARMNALDLMDTASILHDLKRFAHSVFFSTLAIEEAGKLPVILSIFLGFSEERAKLWHAYRQHRAKTLGLNVSIEARVRVNFPQIPELAVKEIGRAVPTPDDLEFTKQMAVYSDCIEEAGEMVCHLPRNSDWRNNAWERLCEAQAIVHALRDYPPEELEIWLKHAKQVQIRGEGYQSMLKPLHDELLEKGILKEGQWKFLLAYLEEVQKEKLS
jgi:AbiV family abortive infection protein